MAYGPAEAFRACSTGPQGCRHSQGSQCLCSGSAPFYKVIAYKCRLAGWYSELGLRRRIPGLAVALGEVHGGVGEEWKVQNIEPDHRLAALVAMIVPVPGRGDDHIPSGKGHLLALHSGKPIAIDDETASKGDVTMSRGNLAGVDDLETAIDSVRGKGSLCETVLKLCVGRRSRSYVLKPGFTSISTRRSACSSGTRWAAVSRCGSDSLYFQM